MSVSPPDYIGIWKLLYDWQTIIAGAAAIFGGWIAYRAGVKQAQPRENLPISNLRPLLLRLQIPTPRQ